MTDTARSGSPEAHAPAWRPLMIDPRTALDKAMADLRAVCAVESTSYDKAEELENAAHSACDAHEALCHSEQVGATTAQDDTLGALKAAHEALCLYAVSQSAHVRPRIERAIARAEARLPAQATE